MMGNRRSDAARREPFAMHGIAPTHRERLRFTAKLLERTRDFFAARSVLEVITPALSPYAPTDVHIHSLHTEIAGLGRRWLHTSPEYAMKRLLVEGSGDIWQLCRVFRDAERGRLHTPEFLLLEWYRVGWDERRLAGEVVELLRHLLDGYRDVGPVRTLSYMEASRETDMLSPALGNDGPCIVTDWPVEQAALARIRDGDPPAAARFEVFLDGVELANGYHELADAAEQRARFDADNARRADLGLPTMPIDEDLLAALEDGLPDCAGVAMGFDRVAMLAAGKDSL